MPRPARSCTRKTPIPKRLLGEADLLVEAEPKTDVEKVKEMEVESPRVKNTPRRFVVEVLYITPDKSGHQGPVVQSIISLTSLLVINIFTVLVSTIFNSHVFFAEKM